MHEDDDTCPTFDTLRRQMVEQQLRARGIADPRVLAAMGSVPREEFVPHDVVESAYEDRPSPIGSAQTISQPYVVAFALEAARIRPGDVVLDVGTGSGYAAAVASLLARRVHSVERIPELAVVAAERLKRLRYANVEVGAGDASLGWPARAPYDVIVSAAASETVPEAWIRQLATGGRIIAPIGPENGQRLVRVTKTKTGQTREDLLAVRYVPLVRGGGAAADTLP